MLWQLFRIALGTPCILVTKFLLKSPTKSPISNFFSVSSHQNVLYKFVAINISKQLQLNCAPHLMTWNRKKWWFELGDLVGDFTKKWWLEWTARFGYCMVTHLSCLFYLHHLPNTPFDIWPYKNWVSSSNEWMTGQVRLLGWSGIRLQQRS